MCGTSGKELLVASSLPLVDPMFASNNRQDPSNQGNP
jgi:hypothetical protein